MMIRYSVLLMGSVGLLFFSQQTFGQQAKTHQVRFRNEYRRPVETLSVGSVEFSNIAPGQETDYMPIEAGGHDIRGRLSGMGYIFLKGYAFFPFDRKEQWTIILTEDRSFSVKEDREIAEERAGAQQVNLIRLKNNFSKRIVSIYVGPVSFRDVRPGQTTGYRPIPPGVYQIAGEAEDFGPDSLRGTVVIDNKGNEKFTEILSPAGTFTLHKD